MEDIEIFSTYLKKYSTISDKFIDDFFSFYKYNTSDEDLIINIELISKGLMI